MKSYGELPTVKWRWPSPSVSNELIAMVEKHWGVRFPQDYIECARENHGGSPDRECFDFPGRKEAVFSRLLSFTREGEKATLTAVYDGVEDRMPEGVFPFAEDPFGNLICFDYRDSTAAPQIAFWNHKIAHSDPEKAMSYICDNFTELAPNGFSASAA